MITLDAVYLFAIFNTSSPYYGHYLHFVVLTYTLCAHKFGTDVLYDMLQLGVLFLLSVVHVYMPQTELNVLVYISFFGLSMRDLLNMTQANHHYNVRLLIMSIFQIFMIFLLVIYRIVLMFLHEPPIFFLDLAALLAIIACRIFPQKLIPAGHEGSLAKV